jgi:hypothetical protein
MKRGKAQMKKPAVVAKTKATRATKAAPKPAKMAHRPKDQ